MQAKRPESIKTNYKRQSILGLVGDYTSHPHDAETGRMVPFDDATPVENKTTSDSPKRAREEHLALNVKKYMVDQDHTSTMLKLSPSDPLKMSRDIRFDFRNSHIMTIDEIEERQKHKKNSAKTRFRLPAKHVLLAACLLVVGLIMLIIGTVYAAKSNDPQKGIAFWVLGGVCVLPGLFSAWTLCRVCYAKNVDARRRAMEVVPKD